MQGSAPAPRRRVAAFLLTLALCPGILVQALWLASPWVFEAWGAARIEARLEGLLGGQVKLGRLRGRLISEIGLEVLSLENGSGSLRTIEGLQLQASYSLWSLLQGKLRGLEQVAISAERVELQLGAASSASKTKEPWPALSAEDIEAAGVALMDGLQDLLPRGARLSIRQLVLRRGEEHIAGTARLQIAAQPTQQRGDRRLVATLDFARTHVEVHSSGAEELELHARIQDPARWATLFAGTQYARAGFAEFAASMHADKATAASEPKLAVQAKLRLGDLKAVKNHARQSRLVAARGMPLPTLEAQARFDGQNLSIPKFRLDGRGLRVHGGDFSIDLLKILNTTSKGRPEEAREDRLSAIAASLSGYVSARIDDAAPWMAYLPNKIHEQLQEALPLQVAVDAKCREGKLAVERCALSGKGFKLSLASKELQWQQGDLSAELQFEASFDERAPIAALIGQVLAEQQLKVPARLEQGSFRGSARITANNVDAQFKLDLALRNSLGQREFCRGKLAATAALGAQSIRALDAAQWSFEPRLAISGPAFPELEGLQLSGGIDWQAERLDLRELQLVGRRQGRLQIDGSLALGQSDLQEIARRSQVHLLLRDFALDALGPITAIPDFGGKAGGELRWNSEDGQLLIDLDARISGISKQPAELTVHAMSNNQGSRVDAFRLRIGQNQVQATAKAPGLPALSFLNSDWAALRERIMNAALVADGSLDLREAASLNLERWGLPSVVGRLQADFGMRATLRAPRLQAKLAASQLSFTLPDMPGISALSGIAELTAVGLDSTQLTVPRLSFVLAGEAGRPTSKLALHAKLAHRGSKILIEDCTLSQSKTAYAKLRAELNDWRSADLLATSTLELAMHGFDLRPFVQQREARRYLRAIDGNLHWKPSPSGPQLRGRLSTSSEGIDSIRLDLAGNQHRIAVENIRIKTPAGELRGHAQLPESSLARALQDPLQLLTTKLDAKFSSSAFDLSRLDPKRLGLEDLSGTLEGSLQLDGSITKPVPLLAVEIAKGSLRLAGAPRIEAIQGALHVTAQAVQITSLTAVVGAAPLSLEGSFQSKESLLENWRDGTLAYRIRGDKVLLWRRDGLRIRANLDLTAKGPLSDFVIAGKVGLVQCKVARRIPYVDLSHRGGETVRDGIVLRGVTLPHGVHGKLDLQIETLDSIAVRTNVYKGGISAALAIEGPLAAPLIIGTLNAVQDDLRPASLKLPGLSLRLDSMLVTFTRQDPRFPKIHLQAHGRRHGYAISLLVRGNSKSPELVLSSNPPLPAEELAVLVATGARPSTLRNNGTRGVSTLVGSYVVEELADYLFGSESTEAKESFLERFTIETGTEISANGTESIVIEFRALPNLWLQGERDVFEDVNFGLVYRLRFK